MKVRALRHCDAELPEGKRALFEGQFYDLPEAAAKPLISAGALEAIEPQEKMQRPVRDKSVRGPRGDS